MAQAQFTMQGQEAVVTGGGGGIGRAIAATGADISLRRLCPNGARRWRRRSPSWAAPVTMAKTEQVRAMVDAAAARFGRTDILVNNASGVSRKAFLEPSENSWRRHIDLNLVSLFAATTAAVPVMIAGGRGGAIVNETSIGGSRAAPGYVVYAACKAGMDNFTRTMALELADHDMRVNAIAPDFTVTPDTRGNVTASVDDYRS